MLLLYKLLCMARRGDHLTPYAMFTVLVFCSQSVLSFASRPRLGSPLTRTVNIACGIKWLSLPPWRTMYYWDQLQSKTLYLHNFFFSFWRIVLQYLWLKYYKNSIIQWNKWVLGKKRLGCLAFVPMLKRD